MFPIKFPGQNCIFAEKQAPYAPLPGLLLRDDEMVPLVSCWQLSETELQEIIRTRKVWVTTLTFGQVLQPFVLNSDRPFALRDLPEPETVEEEFPPSEELLEDRVAPPYIHEGI